MLADANVALHADSCMKVHHRLRLQGRLTTEYWNCSLILPEGPDLIANSPVETLPRACVVVEIDAGFCTLEALFRALVVGHWVGQGMIPVEGDDPHHVR